ncbi:GNAT family N-acetyltransferase [Vreelandella sulfidaeris]|uniref:GNAT family N-acetyltransferase n=1 Tax=Vreelandella sulfidaeris TaxID=115553 RepID=UPI0035E96D2C
MKLLGSFAQEQKLVIRLMVKEDLAVAALVHASAFPRQGYSFDWLACNLNAFPRYLMFVASSGEDIYGYIAWAQKSGFRPEAVLELEQLAVMPDVQGHGIGRQLITDSLPLVKAQLALKNSVLKSVMVSTRADNHAQKLYKQTLGAEVVATISNLYSADEVLMVARNVG